MRGVLLAVTSGGLAVSAHALAHGGLPDTALTLLLVLLVGWTGGALAERTRGPLGVLTVLGSAQLLMHVVLDSLMPHPGSLPIAMFAAHAAATLVTGLLLAHAESLLRVVAERLSLLLPVLFGPLPPPPLPPGAPAPAPGPAQMSVLLCRMHARRGPPVPGTRPLFHLSGTR
ncbi:hypothetical protein [Amycolatopsis viridis]|uniref:Uncharacterized protein n=1 Tax=Amycolatopsis viridis TaxID=185678 RepID=A0ABX0SQD8_9PSEU|nr:hypothetical protein [Amycolatopsis viridis]NIH77571.1 hypothetical protein [Amycolatopsis viridis]